MKQISSKITWYFTEKLFSYWSPPCWICDDVISLGTSGYRLSWSQHCTKFLILVLHRIAPSVMRGVTNVWQIILTVTEIAQYRYTAVLCDATNSKFRQLSWKQDYYVAWRIKTLAIYLPPVPQDGIDLVGVFIIAVFDMFAVYNTSVFNTAVLLISVYRSCSGHNAFLGLCEAYKFYRLLLVSIVLLQKSSFQLVITTNGLDHFIIFNYGRIRQTGHVRNTVCEFLPRDATAT